MVISTNTGQREAFSLVRHRGKAISTQKTLKDDSSLAGKPSGTRVTVNDLFGAMPVRVKLRALMPSGGSSHTTAMMRIVHGAAVLILAWSKNVSLRIDDTTGKGWFHYTANEWADPPSESSTSSHYRKRNRLPHLLNPFLLLRAAGLVSGEHPSKWIPVSGQSISVAVRGYISLEGSPVKSHQFISLGIIPLKDRHGSDSLLFDSINHLFADSDFGVTEDEGETSKEEQSRRENGGTLARNDLGRKQKKSRKILNQWPQFYLRIQVSDCPQERLLLESISWHELVQKKAQEVIGAVIVRFLSRHHFRPNIVRVNGERGEAIPQQATLSLTTSATRQPAWRAAKGYDSNMEDTLDLDDSGHPREFLGRYGRDRNLPELARSESELRFPPMKDSRGTISSFSSSKIRGNHEPQYSSAREHDVNTAAQSPSQDGASSLAPDTQGHANPNTNRCCHSLSISSTQVDVIDVPSPASGLRAGLDLSNRENNPLAAATFHFRKLKRARPRSTITAPDFLCEWHNPVFDPGEARISQLVPSYLIDENRAQRNTVFTADLTTVGHEISITRQDLAQCTVLGQVDRKFILILTKAPNSSLLIIDQHAADERLRVEGLFDEICNLHTNDAAEPDLRHGGPRNSAVRLTHELHFEPESAEINRLQTLQPDLARWGVELEVSDDRCTVSRLPALVAERCAANPQMLFDMLRSEAWHRTASSHRAKKPPPKNGGRADWVTSIQDCPGGIVEMLKSRACRSAIMFNDELSTVKCEELVRRLARTRFPFSCAHGRRSVVPLVGEGLRGLGSSEDGSDRDEGGLRARFEDWRFTEMLVGSDFDDAMIE